MKAIFLICCNLLSLHVKLVQSFSGATSEATIYFLCCALFVYSTDLICSCSSGCQREVEVTLKLLLQNNKLKAWAGLKRLSYDTSTTLPGHAVLQRKQWIKVKSHLEFLIQVTRFTANGDGYPGQREEYPGLGTSMCVIPINLTISYWSKWDSLPK